MGAKFLPIFLLIFVLVMYGFSNSYDKSWSFDWSRIRPQVKDSVLKVKRYGSLVSLAHYKEEKNQYKTQIWILKKANTFELKQLINHPNDNIKALSFEGLLRKTEINKYLMLKKILNDTLSFVKISGACFNVEMHLSEYLLKQRFGFGLKKPRRNYRIEDELTIEQLQDINERYISLKQNEDIFKNIVYGEEYPITNYVWE